MAHLIDKEVLVAEIKRRISEVEQIDKASYEVGLLDAYKIILSFINTLEVKEIDSTDAFIKKASFWLECNLSDRPMEDRKFWVEDFVNYMKGE